MLLLFIMLVNLVSMLEKLSNEININFRCLGHISIAIFSQNEVIMVDDFAQIREF